MRSIALGLSCALFLSAAPAAAFQNEPTGFRGIEWFAPFEQVSDGMTLISSKGDQAIYSRTSDKLEIGAVPLRSITYEFNKGRFINVFIRIPLGSLVDVRQTFFAQFGPAEQPNRFIPDYLWRGEITEIALLCSEIRKECRVGIASHAFSEFQRQEKAAAARAAGKDF